MSASSTWIAAYNVTLTVNGVAQSATDCTIKRTIEKWDASNLLGAGWEEHGTGLKSGTMSGSIVLDSAALRTFTLGSLVTGSFATSGGQTHSGSGRILDITEKGGAKGGFMVGFEWSFTAAITTA